MTVSKVLFSLAENACNSFVQNLMLDRLFVCLIDLILYISVNSFSVMSGQVFLGLTSTKQKIHA